MQETLAIHLHKEETGGDLEDLKDDDEGGEEYDPERKYMVRLNGGEEVISQFGMTIIVAATLISCRLFVQKHWN